MWFPCHFNPLTAQSRTSIPVHVSSSEQTRLFREKKVFSYISFFYIFQFINCFFNCTESKKCVSADAHMWQKLKVLGLFFLFLLSRTCLLPGFPRWCHISYFHYTVAKANNLGPNEMPNYTAFHSDPGCLTSGIQFYQRLRGIISL